MQELLGHCVDQSRRNDSAIAALETHLRQYGYAGDFQHSGAALPVPDHSSRPAGQADSHRSSAVPKDRRLGHEGSLQIYSSTPSPPASSPPRHHINTRDSPALLPLDNVLPERDVAVLHRAMGGKGGEHICDCAQTTCLILTVSADISVLWLSTPVLPALPDSVLQCYDRNVHSRWSLCMATPGSVARSADCVQNLSTYDTQWICTMDTHCRCMLGLDC